MSDFYVSPLAAGISLGSIVLAALSYFLAPEKYRNPTIYAAYWILLSAIGTLTITTGATNSPFVATWMIAAIFAGIFGPATLAVLFIGLNGLVGYEIFSNNLNNEMLIGIILAGELPILVSYILWHGKSSSEKTKERAYYDLANELNQVSNKSEVVISAISDGVIAVDNEGVIELINPAAQRIVGWGHQDALGLDYKSVLQLLSKDNHELDKSTDPVFNVLSTNQPLRRSDLQAQTNSGKKINVDIVVSPIGRMGSGAIIVFRDVTKEQEEGRVQAEFISTASHEMRTPVASIEGYLGLALNPATATIDAKARDFITKAHEAAQHLGRLFQDLLDVTKADDGRLSNNPKVIEMVDFTSNIIESLKPKAIEKNLRIFYKPDSLKDDGGLRNVAPVFYTNLDSDHLREVLANLIENAIKYTPKGEVVIDVKGDETHVVVSIADSGIGIPAEDIPHLFQKFYRVDNTDTREIGGTGLGLYLCRRLVEAMGGRIWVDSEYKKGSTFSIELPRISHEEATRLIEVINTETIQPIISKPYLGDDNDEGMTPKEKAEALSTPIVLNKSTPVSSATPASAAPVAADPLLGGEAVNTPPVQSSQPVPAAQPAPAAAQQPAQPAAPAEATTPITSVTPPVPAVTQVAAAIPPTPVSTATASPDRPLAVPER